MSIVRTHADHDLTALLGSTSSSKAGAAYSPPEMTSKTCLCILNSQLNNFYHQQNTLFFLVSFLNALFSPPSIMTIVKNADRHFLSQLHRVKTKLPQNWYSNFAYLVHPSLLILSRLRVAQINVKAAECVSFASFVSTDVLSATNTSASAWGWEKSIWK